MRLKTAVLATLIATLTLALGSSAVAQAPLVLTDLSAPRGLDSSGAALLVADQGNGRILRVTPQGSVMVIADGIPSEVNQSPEGNDITGVTSVIDIGGAYYYLVGESGENTAGFDSLYSVTTSTEPVLLADLGAYEEANNTDGDVGLDGEPELLSNPFDLVHDGALGVYVSVSGANAVLHVPATGGITPFAVFPNRDNPLFPAVGGPTMDQVPTGIEVGPDGALYVTTLTGFPFPAGEARIYRLEDLNGDGDALDEGESTISATGLTTATNLAFDQDGSLLVTEFSVNMLAEAPGRLVRVVDGKIAEVIADPLITPTGVAVLSDGTVVVSQEFAGIVAEVHAAQAIAEDAAGEGPPPDGGITPPSTGGAGLADGGPKENAAALIFLAAGAALGALRLAAKRIASR